MSATTIAGLSVEEGAFETGRRSVGALADGSPIRLPVAVMRGRRDGPRVHIQACTHGYEITGLEIARQLMSRIDPDELAGTITFAPIANLPAYLTRSYTFAHEERMPGHPIDLSRYLPGDPDGFLTERIGWFLWEEFITPADYAIDLHSGAGGSTIAPMCYTTASWNETMARVAGAQFVVPYEVLRGVGVYRPRVYPPKAWVKLALEEHDVRATLIEMGEGGHITWDVVPTGVACVENVLREVGSIEGDLEKPFESLTVDNIEAARNDHGGTLRTLIEPGDAVETGETIGVIADPFGEETTVTAPTNGYAMRVLVGKQIVYPGAEIAWIAEA